MKYQQIRIELKSTNQLEGLDYCPDCKAKLSYRNSSCYCEKENKEFTFYVVSEMPKK
jgi:predicted amidophosphoribosyltransferase